MLTAGVDNLTGTADDDTFNATETATSSVLGGLDVVDGGAGNDTLNVADTATGAAGQFSLPAGFTVENVENVNVTTNGGVDMDVSGIAGVEAVKTVAAGTANTSVTAADTTDVTTTTAGSATTTVSGGKNVSATASAAGTGTTTITGDALETVSVKGGGVVSVDNLGGAAGTTTSVGTTLTAVTLDSIAGATAAVKGAAVEELTVQNQDSALATTVTNGTSKSLAVNVDNAGYDSTGTAVGGVTVAAGAAAETINVNASGSKSNVTVNGAAAKTLNIAGDAALTLVSTTAFTKLDGSTATGNLALGDLNAATVTVDTGAGNDSFAIQATNKTAVNTGEGNDVVTLKSAVAAGSTVNLGAGDDALLAGTGGSVAASTATDSTVIDAGEGRDTVSAALINAANAAQFVNFEALDLSASVTNLDVELMTGSDVEALTLTGDGGSATTAQVSNVAAGVGLSVSGDNATGGSTTINIKDAATNTDDSFAISFDNEEVAGAAATAANVKAGTVVANGVEDLTIASDGGENTWNSVTVTDDKLQTLTITGEQNLDVAFTGTNGTNASTGGGAVSLIDGSAATGDLVINTTNVVADNEANVGLTVKTGAGDDAITLAGEATVEAGAGDDVITTAAAGGKLTGGAGDDEFDVSLAVATGATEATSVLTTITDFGSGDKIDFGTNATGAFNSTKVDLDSSVTDLEGALAQVGGANAANETSWFQYGGNTYIVADTDAATASGDFGAGDTVVELTGNVDLSGATLAGTELSIA